jgi:hypothetical protein
MTRERFLTVRWNNWISLALGLLPLAYMIVVWSTPVLSAGAGFTGLVVIGVVY